MLHVKPPEELQTSAVESPCTWDKWKVRFEIFLKAGGAFDKPDAVKVGLLLHHIGNEGVEIYQNFEFAETESRDDYATVLRKFEAFFNRRDPQLMLREKYWYSLHREEGQSFDSWVRTVKDKATACKFASQDTMVRDKLIFSCRDDSAKLKLYDIGASLTLRKRSIFSRLEK